MTRSVWVAGAMGVLLVGGCASQDKEMKNDVAMLGRVPIAQKQPIFAAQNNLQVALANEQAAEQGVQHARQFQEITNKQLEAARSRFEAAQSALKLSHEAQTQVPTQELQQAAGSNLQASEKELAAFYSKKQFADTLAQERQLQLDLSKREVDLANADLSLARAQIIQKNGMQPQESVQALTGQRAKVQSDLYYKRAQLQAMEGQVNQLRTAWLQQRHQYNVASRSMTAAPLSAPPAPEHYQPVPVPKQQQGGSYYQQDKQLQKGSQGTQGNQGGTNENTPIE